MTDSDKQELQTKGLFPMDEIERDGAPISCQVSGVPIKVNKTSDIDFKSTSTKSYREWWLRKTKQGAVFAYDMPLDTSDPLVHVIEYAAYENIVEATYPEISRVTKASALKAAEALRDEAVDKYHALSLKYSSAADKIVEQAAEIAEWRTKALDVEMHPVVVHLQAAVERLKDQVAVLSYRPQSELMKERDALTALLDKAAVALEFYADEDGGPYAPGDYHSADGGAQAKQALDEIKRGRGE